MTLQAVTANRLADGAVVFRTPAGAWSTDVAAAAAVATGEAELLKAAEADAARQIVVGPYLIAVAAGAAGPVPTVHRERIRAYGPSIGLPGAGEG
ncbi:MAG: DUF2849 domain-containing protein [Alphaproteobacteria bacterium]|nr:DUF2849 domain-containing protein [Alphaproteobacteria bacterium]